MKGRNRWLLGALFVVALLMGMPRAASSRTLDDIIESGQILMHRPKLAALRVPGPRRATHWL